MLNASSFGLQTRLDVIYAIEGFLKNIIYQYITGYVQEKFIIFAGEVQ